MTDESKKKTHRFGFLWWLLIAAASFATIAPIRGFYAPDNIPAALGFAGVCSVGIVAAIRILVSLSRWAFGPSNIWRLLYVMAATALVTGWTIKLPYGYDSVAPFIAVARAFFLVLLLVATISFFFWLRKGRRLWVLLGLLGGFVLLVILFYAEENWRGNRAWEKYRKKWEAKGEKFDLMSYVPPPVPDNQNFALAPIVASCYQQRLASPPDFAGMQETNNRLHMQLERTNSAASNLYPTNSGNWMLGRSVDLAAFQNYYRATKYTNEDWAETNIINLPLEFPTAQVPQSPGADVVLALSRYENVIEELRVASRLPYSRFPVNYNAEDPSGILLPHLANLKACVEVMRMRAVAELQSGQTEQGLADVKLMLRLISSIRSEPILISQLVRALMLKLTLQPVWEGLLDHHWSEPQLVSIQDELGKLNFMTDNDFVLRAERAGTIKTIEYARTHRDMEASSAGYFILTICPRLFVWIDEKAPQWVSDFLSPMIPDKSLEHVIRNLAPEGWYQQNKLSLSEYYRVSALPLVDPKKLEVPSCIISNAEDSLSRTRYSVTPYNCLTRSLVPALSRSTMKFAQAQASADMARVACALERYHLANGEYPETLGRIAPQFINTVPHDVIHGEPLKYHRTDDERFVLYSIGWNEKDDGGEVGGKYGGVNPEEGDWVWLSAPEIETNTPSTATAN